MIAKLTTVFGQLNMIQRNDLCTGTEPFEPYADAVELCGALDVFGERVDIGVAIFKKTVWCDPAESSGGFQWTVDGGQLRHLASNRELRDAVVGAIFQALRHFDEDIILRNAWARQLYVPLGAVRSPLGKKK